MALKFKDVKATTLQGKLLTFNDTQKAQRRKTHRINAWLQRWLDNRRIVCLMRLKDQDRVLIFSYSSHILASMPPKFQNTDSTLISESRSEKSSLIVSRRASHVRLLSKYNLYASSSFAVVLSSFTVNYI